MPALPFPFAGRDGAHEMADPDYLHFLRHIRPDGNSYVLELPPVGAAPPTLLKYERPTADSNGRVECAPNHSPRLGGSKRRLEEESSLAASLVDEDYRLFLEHSRVVNGRVVFEMGNLVINYEVDAVRSGGGKQVEEEAEAAAVVDALWKENGVEEEKGGGPDGRVAILSESSGWDWRADPAPRREKVEEKKEDERLWNTATLRTPKIVKTETSPTEGNDAKPPVALGLQGVIWPMHIIQRPDSDYKRRLLYVLNKPFNRKEYHELLGMATIRTPLMKLRQVRNDSKFYPTDEMGNSYFDYYPDLAKQIRRANYPNGLALLRGFFFWLQNNAHEDQFMPWIADSKYCNVVPLKDSDNTH